MNDWTDLEKYKRLEKSIIYAIKEYQIRHDKEPSCVLVNDVAGEMLQMVYFRRWVSEDGNVLLYIYGTPLKICYGWEQEDIPKFWLCEEGEVI